ncbi:carbon-nitrogen hydrolase, partial [Pseudomonas frederiksbergensis]|nr:carbon-nitrogen hydrolase [Pseudomonas frederiksbergensis]
MRIALFQGEPQPLDLPGNLERLHQQAQLAAARGAELLVCPEMFLTGYNIGSEAVARLAEAED